ncbi:MAG: tetratricopeptide repeat protein [Candidatus Omnitrophota bacterium]
MAQEAAADMTQVQNNDLEQILETLNGTLKENLEIRETLKTAQEGLEKLALENNTLKSRLRNLEKNVETKQSDLDRSAVETREAKAKIRETAKLLEESEAKNQETSALLAESSAKITQMESMLKTAILEDEKKEYEAMIAQAREQVEALKRLFSENEKDKMKLRDNIVGATFELGNVFFENRNYAAAEEYYQRVLDENPAHAGAHHNLGILYDYYYNDVAKAIYHYEKYMGLEPLDEQAKKIKERVLDMKLTKKLLPDEPLLEDFNRLHRSDA